MYCIWFMQYVHYTQYIYIIYVHTPLLRGCVHGVCVCVHLDGLNAEHKFHVTSLHHFTSIYIVYHFIIIIIIICIS